MLKDKGDDKLSDNKKLEALELATGKQFDYIGAKTDVLVIYCADPRFRDTFREFISDELGVDHYILLSLAGAAGPFVQFDSESEKAKQFINQVKLFVEKAGVKKLIVMNHTDCKWYSNVMPGIDTDEIINKQIDDLDRFTEMTNKEIGEISVETYLAIFENNKVSFRTV